jgi:hypothetical protein
MGLKGYRLWVMGQLDSTCKSPTVGWPLSASSVSIWLSLTSSVVKATSDNTPSSPYRQFLLML